MARFGLNALRSATDYLAWSSFGGVAIAQVHVLGGVAMVLDSRRARVIALCGAHFKRCYAFSDQRYYEDVRVLDPAQPTGWDTLPVPGGSGPRRWGAAAVYDSIGDRVFLFGGRQDDGGTPSDVWILDLATATLRIGRAPV